MKIRSWLCLLACLALSLSALASPAEDKKLRKEIETYYSRLTQAMKNRDAKAVLALGTSDFSLSMSGQTLSGKKLEESLKQMYAITKAVEKLEMKITSITPKGDSVIVTTAYEMVSLVQPPGAKTTNKMGEKGSMRDLFVKVGKTWKAKRSEALKVDFTVDGKPFNPFAAPSAPPKP